MAPWFANQSCDPFLPREAQCVLGTYVQYAVNVSQAGDVAAAIDFATKRNIRVAIRNTGHEYLRHQWVSFALLIIGSYNGKSTGAGALAIWTHHLKEISITQSSDSYYTGKVIKMGAGVQGFEAYDAANAKGLQVVGGECPTVGLAGGYTQGGGHSALASRHGLAADQALEWEVVTGSGEHLVANRQQNSDLFWALSGGGGGTYGVVLSLTAKIHDDVPTVGANLTFNRTSQSSDAFYDAIFTYHASLPAIVDLGAMSLSFISNESFRLSPLTAPGLSVETVAELLTPLMRKLEELNIPYDHHIEQFPGYLQEFHAMQAPIPVATDQYAGRLIPRSVVLHNNSVLTDAIRFIVEEGAAGWTTVALNVSKAVAGDVYNAVNPAWRETLLDTVLTTPWSFQAPLSAMEADQHRMIDDVLPKLEALTPDGACYLNEGTFLQPDWQSVFYGPNYEALKAIKDKFDPNHMFYGLTAVGSEYWMPQADGRLCRA